jgi:tripartite-type tricarboxylate transporter receptor subunit TctC
MKTGDTTLLMRRMVCASLLSLLAVGACAQAPTLRILVPFPAGGVTDLAARALAERLGHALGQTVIVENRPGGGSRIGTDAAIKAAPDGQTLLFTNTSYAILPIVDPTVKIEADKSMRPVGMLATYGLAFAISNSIPATSLSEFVAHARSRPGKLSYGSSGPGSGTHFLGEYFKSLTGTFIVHIPYRSTAGAVCRCRQGARARGDGGAARSAHAQRADGGGGRAQGLRDRELGRPAGARGHARGLAGAPERGAQRGTGRAGVAPAPAGDGADA